MKPPAGVVAALTLVILASSVLTVGSAPSASADTACPTASSQYSGGSGTSGDPYLISAPGDLQRLRDTSGDYTRSFLLTQDITMGGCVWSTPIASGATTFTGRLDGDGHVIRGLSVTVSNPALGYVGLVGYLGANGEIRDLGFTGDVSVTDTTTNGFAYVGGLVGFTYASTTISGSFATGDVTVAITSSTNSIQAHAGGLIGYSQSTVTNSYASGDVSVSAVSTAGMSGSVLINAGGLIGYTGPGQVTVAYSTGSVTSSGTSAMTQNRQGGFIGAHNGIYLFRNFWNTESSGQSSATGMGSGIGITGVSTAQMKTDTTFTSAGWSLSPGFDATSTWGICSLANDGNPFLTAFYATSPCIQNADPAQAPPSWFQATGRRSMQEPCEPGWNPSWAQWMNDGSGGYVCMREIYWDIRTWNWAVR